jgi:3-hydroxyisobutyrate dehydrogenase-like beta-hydroxyacid dehydrogenase
VSDSEPEPAVALLGTGIIGLGMGRSLLRAGIPVRAWNRTRRRAEPLYADGALVVDRAADAVRGAGIIITVLSDSAAVADVLAVARPGLVPGQLWIQASTVGVQWNDELAGLARDRDPAAAGETLALARGLGPTRFARATALGHGGDDMAAAFFASFGRAL